eukprot:596963-Amphidinium_carterae.1
MEKHNKRETPVFDENSFPLRAFFLPLKSFVRGGERLSSPQEWLRSTRTPPCPNLRALPPKEAWGRSCQDHRCWIYEARPKYCANI